MTSSAPRAPIDFDAFERDLRQAGLPEGDPSAATARGGVSADPLAELARIVGQDDPFRALLQTRQAPNTRVEPSFEAAPSAQGNDAHGNAVHGNAHATGYGAEPAFSPADAFDQYLASVERQGAHAEEHDHGHLHGQDPAAHAPAAGPRGLLAGRPRRHLVQVGAGLGVLVVCVTGALGFKALHSHGSDGGPVTVLADRTPLKVAPTAADGVEIPDQNKQIYERSVKDGQIKVVNREEQPLDVAQAARTGRDAGATTPGNTAMLTDSLGEPRRVRTVLVKPDTPPASVRADAPQDARQDARQDAQHDAPGPRTTQVASAEPVVGRAPPSLIPTMSMPDASPTSSAAASAAASATPDPTAQSRRPSRTLASTGASTNASASASTKPAPVTEAPAADAVPAARGKTNQRVASVNPEEIPTASAQTDASPASTASVGGYSVQLGVRNSESDAQAAFKQMQGKYSQLAGKPALIRQAEVDGRSLYRVRVGPLAKAEASSLCTALKGAGGQCFVAKN